jgi:predicted N-acetyltransferase YhbS
MSVLIRGVTPNDYKFISVLNLELGYEFPENEVAARIRYISENTNDIILVADINGEVVGYIHASPYELMFSQPVLNIVAFVVNKKQRGMGVGHRLITELEKMAHENKFTCIRLTSAMHRAEAHRFYEIHGFSGKEVKLYKKALFE